MPASLHPFVVACDGAFVAAAMVGAELREVFETILIATSG